VAVAGAGGFCFSERSRGLGACRQVNGGPEERGLNAKELGGYCRERCLFPEQVDRWRQAAQDANVQQLLTIARQKDLQTRYQEDQRKIKQLEQGRRRKEKALAEAAALLIASKKVQAFWGEDRDD